jgi:asparagine synthase (glutamine-hydrolysing)
MCGIAGILHPTRNDSIVSMTNAILHRGPDDSGFFTDEIVSLGMRRLSIIDLSGGHQPIESEDGNLMIFFNGEIYNYKELKNELVMAGRKFITESDTEVVLGMFEKYGTGSFTRLRGMFAFAIYNKSSKKLILVRDFFGIKPLYYWAVSEKVIGFASEIKSFLALSEFKLEVNDEAVFNYLSYQYNPLDETFFKNVFKLPPAHYMTINAEDGSVRINKYWHFEFKPDYELDEKVATDEIFKTMRDSVEHHMIADVPVGSFLSGGIDSSVIATLMQEIRGSSKIKTFTVGFDTLSEGVEAKETSSALGTDHTEITVSAKEYFEALPKAVWHFDEPVADPSAIGLYFLAREARKKVKVVLSGEGSDELFGGYNIYLEPFARRKISWIPRPILAFIASFPANFKGKNYAKRALMKLSDRYIGNASVFDESELKELWRGTHKKKYSLKPFYQKVTGLGESTKMQYIDIHTWLVGDILAKADKMTMAHSLELRVPFLDIEVARLASTLLDRFKWRGGRTKFLLREAFRGVLPESTRRRKKLGFPTPVGQWFNRDRVEVLETIIGNSYIKTHFNVNYIRHIWENHTEGRIDSTRRIYLLYMLSLWYNIFIEKQKI